MDTYGYTCIIHTGIHIALMNRHKNVRSFDIRNAVPVVYCFFQKKPRDILHIC